MSKVILLVLVLATGACGPKRKNQCAGNTAGHCLMGERCTFDKARGCQVCICEPIDGDGTNPNRHDDPSGPTPISN